MGRPGYASLAEANRRAALLVDGALAAVRDRALTARELEVGALIARGLSNKAIADELDISGHTVKFHVRHVAKKLGHSTRAGAAAELVRRRLVP